MAIAQLFAEASPHTKPNDEGPEKKLPQPCVHLSRALFGTLVVFWFNGCVKLQRKRKDGGKK
jgi:hypothetical protein